MSAASCGAGATFSLRLTRIPRCRSAMRSVWPKYMDGSVTRL